MRDTLRRWPQKAAAVLSLWLAAAPVFVVLGRYAAPEDARLWYAPGAVALALGLWICAVPAKRRLPALLIGLGVYLGGGVALVWPLGVLAALTLLPGAVLLIMLPPACGRMPWEEWPTGLWAGGVAAHLVAQGIAAKGGVGEIASPLAWMFAAYLFLLLFTLNRQSLRAGVHGAEKAPAALRSRNRALTIALFALALLAACWGTLSRALGSAWTQLKLWLGAAIAWLMRLFPAGTTGAGDGGTGGTWGDMLSGLPTGEASPFARLMEKVFMVLAALIALAALLVAVRLFYRKLRALMRRLLDRARRYAAQAGEEYTDEVESTLDFDERRDALRKRLRRALERRARPVPYEKLNGRERVRRLFAQYLRGKPDVPASATAREALEKEKTLPEKQASVFAELYDRARYSDHPVSEAEADRLKRELRGS